MAKKTYKAPTVKAINIAATEILAGSLKGSINTGSGSGNNNNNYDDISGYDSENGGWAVGSPS